ncbi:MAG: hypothetical protein V1707_01435 [bacterium]
MSDHGDWAKDCHKNKELIMGNNQMIGSIPNSVFGMLGDLMFKLRDDSITPEQLEKFLKKQNPFQTPDEFVQQQIQKWQSFFKNRFDLDKDLSSIRIPNLPKKGKYRLIIDLAEFTHNGLVKIMRKYFSVCSWTENLDSVMVDYSKRDKIDHAVWVLDTVEADEKLKNLSANVLEKKKISCVTLKERLLDEFMFWDTNGNYLDVKNMTLCAGSRYSDGRVPHVDCHDGEVDVSRGNPDDASDCSRGRAAVL